MSFTVTVLGCAGMFATRERAASGYLLQIADANVWLDAGPGTWRNLLGYIDYADLDAVVLTHHHPDHTSDVFMAYHARVYGQRDPLPKVPLLAPRETIDRLRAFADLDEAFEVTAVAAGEKRELAGAAFSFHRMAHPGETLGVRVEYGGGVFAYSADTGPDGELDALTKDANVFICEATFQEGDEGWEGHMLAGQAAQIASRNGVMHLVLTHLPPSRDLGLSLQQAHTDAEGVRIELADDGRRYEVIG
ncbi:MAG: MBL fold metallo-hydrolase [Actinomycetota bacterium]